MAVSPISDSHIPGNQWTVKKRPKKWHLLPDFPTANFEWLQRELPHKANVCQCAFIPFALEGHLSPENHPLEFETSTFRFYYNAFSY